VFVFGGNVLTEALPSNVRAINIETHRQNGGMYEVCRSDRLRCHDIHTKFYIDWFRHSKVDRWDTQTHRQHGDRISLLLFFQNMESRLKMGAVNVLAQATKLLTCTRRVLGSNFGRDTGSAENFRCFPHSLQANSGPVPRLGYHFLPDPFQFVIHLSSYRSMLCMYSSYWQSRKSAQTWEMGRAYSTYGKKKKCVKSFGSKCWMIWTTCKT
jgi:hypothetical protein